MKLKEKKHESFAYFCYFFVVGNVIGVVADALFYAMVEVANFSRYGIIVLLFRPLPR